MIINHEVDDCHICQACLWLKHSDFRTAMNLYTQDEQDERQAAKARS